MAIYTKTGDHGETSLANGQRVSKTDARIEAYGTVDELNSWIGALSASITRSELLSADGAAVAKQLETIQNKLFNLGASLSCAPGEWITEEDVRCLEQWIDTMQSVVPPMRAFVLPAGGETVTRCHICRTVCRRAERRMTELENCSQTDMQYINRLSDYLFVLARFVGHKMQEKEKNWQKM
ncbi:MAG: cob(I)yrinic acid a,c-diamide adenosyltransferase [Paludibacteraceae bacterium]|nr:cob(I)yrinic acid a,c-diamide adenosyltransferase [Paludibacteraceae bacterium]